MSNNIELVIEKGIGMVTIASGIGAVIAGLYQPNRYIKAIAGLVAYGAGYVLWTDVISKNKGM